MAQVAINGMGRIGRAVFKIILQTPELKLIAVNDLMRPESIAYLLKYDSVYGKYNRDIIVDGPGLMIENRRYEVLCEKDPGRLPWSDMDIDVVFECTGIFNKKESLEKHIHAGARRVVLSAPAKDADIVTVVHGVNQPDPSEKIISCASCTTNCITPVVEIMGRRVGIKKALMTTVHAYTATQNIVDGFNKKVRRGRAGALNFVPTSSGAASATAQVLPQYMNKFDGVAVRAPIPAGSIADIVMLSARDTTKHEINTIFREESESERYRGILGVIDDPIVSSDIIGDPHASIVDLSMTNVVDKDLVKVMSWYDNEWGYSSQMVREALRITHG
jgi:glyceraldehyde 3-phosphate dehydrogenase